jgi:hypothetical protein
VRLPPDSIDYLFALVLAIIAAIVLAASTAVVKFHIQVRRAFPNRRGLLVWHILAIAVGTAGTWGFILLGQLDIMGLLSTPRAVRLAGYSVFGMLTIAAILIIAQSTRRKIHARRADDPSTGAHRLRVTGNE